MSGNKKNNGVHLQGTNEITSAYKGDTPGQTVDVYLKLAREANIEKKKERSKNFSQVFDNPLKGFPYNEDFTVRDMNEEIEALLEGMDFWKVTVTKNINKLKKGQSVIVKARNSSEALTKGATNMGDPKANMSGYMDAVKDTKFPTNTSATQGKRMGESSTMFDELMASVREMDDLVEEVITYRVKGIQKPETDKFETSARLMKLNVSFKKEGSATLVTLTGTKKQLRNFDSIARGKSSYGDPSTVVHFDEDTLDEFGGRGMSAADKDNLRRRIKDKKKPVQKSKRESVDHTDEESEELTEAYQQFLDKSPNWGEDKAISYGRKKGYKEIGVCGHGKIDGIVLFPLDAGDKSYVGKEAKVSTGQTVFRYATSRTVAGDIFPLVKIDVKRGLLYNLSQKSSEGEIEHAEFESSSVKLNYLRLLSTANLRDIVGFNAEVKESVDLEEKKDSPKEFEKKVVHTMSIMKKYPANKGKSDEVLRKGAIKYLTQKPRGASDDWDEETMDESSEAWVLVQNRKIIKKFKTKPSNSAFTSSDNQTLMTVSKAAKMGIKESLEGKWSMDDIVETQKLSPEEMEKRIAKAIEIMKKYPDNKGKSANVLRRMAIHTVLRKKMNESTDLNEGKNLIPEFQEIVNTKGAKKIGGIMVDMFTASVITQAYEKVSDSNKAQMENSDVKKLVGLAQRIMGMKEGSEYKAVANPSDATTLKGADGKKLYDTAVGKGIKEESQNLAEKDSMDGQKLTGQEISVYFRKNKVSDEFAKLAVKIALDHGGAMNYAIKEIEKLKKGLSKHKDVKKALDYANFGENTLPKIGIKFKD